MIRIRTGQLRDAIAELSVHKEQTAELKERLLQIERDVSRQSYTEETVCRLKDLEGRMDEILQDIRSLEEGLADICRTVERTERDIVDTYEGEKRIYRKPVIGETRILLNSRLKEIAEIELQDGGNGVGK